jgi:hypothetical protein
MVFDKLTGVAYNNDTGVALTVVMGCNAITYIVVARFKFELSHMF